MIWFITRRLGAGIALIAVVSTFTFALLFGSVGNVARNILGESATEDQVAAKAAELGLDLPFWQQYTTWFGNAVRGNFGSSWFTSEPITNMVMNRLPVTLSMVVGAVLVTAILSAVLGVVAAVRGGAVDRLLQFIGMLGGAVVIERVFGVPGLGTMAVNAAFMGDVPATMGVIVVMVVLVVIVNLLIDILNGWINPKARLQ